MDTPDSSDVAKLDRHDNALREESELLGGTLEHMETMSHEVCDGIVVFLLKRGKNKAEKLFRKLIENLEQRKNKEMGANVPMYWLGLVVANR